MRKAMQKIDEEELRAAPCIGKTHGRELIRLWRKRADGWDDGMFDAFALGSDENREKRIARTFRICANELEEIITNMPDEDDKEDSSNNKSVHPLYPYA